MSLRPDLLTSLCMLLCSAVWISWLAAAAPLNPKLAGGPNPLLAMPQAEARASNTVKSLDACSLLTGNEIASVLGEPLQEIKPSAQANGNVNMSHCLFVTRDFAKSASLAVATPAAGDSGARKLRAFWRNQFHEPRGQEEQKRPASIKTPSNSAFLSPGKDSEVRVAPESQADGDAEDSANKPRVVSALGEEAYWVSSPTAGALYVLQGELFLRISVGGVPKESARIAKSKSLAAAILSRLPHHPIG